MELKEINECIDKATIDFKDTVKDQDFLHGWIDHHAHMIKNLLSIKEYSRVTEAINE